jgi:glycosyltransferase involved in cell wall biosynthesis
VKVAHLVPALFGAEGTVGGAERYVLELARHMSLRVPTTLVAFGDRDRVTEDGALTIRLVRARHHVRGQRANPIAWAGVREASAADVVHCHQQHLLATSLTALLARLRGRRVFCTDLGGGGWDISAYVSTDRWFHGHLHISRYSRHVFGHDHLATARVIYGGVDADRFSPGDPARDIECLFVGRLLPHKGVDALIEAAPPGMRVVIAGPAPDGKYLGDLRELAQGRQVEFVHGVGDDALVALYRRARVVVLPSVYRDRYGSETRVPELLGQTLLEGMASGAATICTDVASMPEIVVHGVTGLVVPPNDVGALRRALCELRDHPERATEMGRRGRERVLAEFTWPAVVDRCLQAYAA